MLIACECALIDQTRRDMYYQSLRVPSACAVNIYWLQGDQDAFKTVDNGSEVKVSQNPNISSFRL